MLVAGWRACLVVGAVSVVLAGSPTGAVVAQGAAETGRGYAVIVGVADYRGARGTFENFQECANDAIAIAELLADQPMYGAGRAEKRVRVLLGTPDETVVTALKQGRENVEVTTDVTQATVSQALRDAVNQIAEAAKTPEDKLRDLLFVFYSGHGTLVRDEPRLVLPDYDPDAANTYYDLVELLQDLRRCVGTAVVAINACRSGGAADLFAEYGEDISRHSGNRLVIPSTPDKNTDAFVADDGRTLFGPALEGALKGDGGAPVHLLAFRARLPEIFAARAQAKHLTARLGSFYKRDVGPDNWDPIVCEGTARAVQQQVDDELAKLGIAQAKAKFGDGVFLREALLVLGRELIARVGALKESEAALGKARPGFAQAAQVPLYPNWEAELDGWEQDRFGRSAAASNDPLPEAERAARRGKWVEVLSRHLKAEGDLDAGAYRRELANAGIPAALYYVAPAGGTGSRVAVCPGRAPVLKVTDSPGRLSIEVAGAAPVVRAIGPRAHAGAGAAAGAADGLFEWLTGVVASPPEEAAGAAGEGTGPTPETRPAGERPFRLEDEEETPDGSTPGTQALVALTPAETDVPLVARLTEVTLVAVDKDDQEKELFSSPRTVVVENAASFTRDKPEGDTVTTAEATIPVGGLVWHDGEGVPEVKPLATGGLTVRDLPQPEAQPEDPKTYRWKAEIDVPQGDKDAEYTVTFSANRPNGGTAIGQPLSLTVKHVPIQIVEAKPPPEGTRYGWAAGPTPGPGKRVALCLYEGSLPLLQGEFTCGDREVSVTTDPMRPVLGAVRLERFDPARMEVSPQDVPLIRLLGMTERDAGCEGGKPGPKLAYGTYTVKVKLAESDTWEVRPAEFTVQHQPGEGEQTIALEAARWADGALTVSGEPKDPNMKLAITLEPTEGGPAPKQTSLRPGETAGQLEAGDYRLVIKNENDSKSKDELDPARFDRPEGVTVVGEGQGAATLAVAVRRASDLRVALAFRPKAPPRRLPFAVVVESRVRVTPGGGGQPHEDTVPVGGQAVNGVPRDVKKGTVVASTLDGLEYWRGELSDDEVREKEVVRGTFELANAGQWLAEPKLARVEGKVPWGESSPATPPPAAGKLQWANLPVGDYAFTAQVKLDGCDPIPLGRSVQVKGKPEQLDAYQLLDEQTLAGAIPRRSLSITVKQATYARGQSLGGDEAAVELVTLEPERGRAESLTVGPGLEELGKAGCEAARKVLEDYTAPAPVADGAGLRYDGLWEGTYKVSVKQGAEWLTPEPATVTIGGADAAFVLELRSWREPFPFTLRRPEAAKEWVIGVSGSQRTDDPLVREGAVLLPLEEEKEAGPVEIATKGGPVFWKGKLEGGKLSGEGGDGFVRHVIQLNGRVPGMAEPTLSAQTGKVPYVDTVPGDWKPKWGEPLPVGEYELAVAGFEPRAVSLKDGDALVEANTLTPVLAELVTAFEGAVTAEAMVSCKLNADRKTVPALALDPKLCPEIQPGGGLDLKNEGWKALLPCGTYRVAAEWDNNGARKRYEGDLALAEGTPARLKLVEAEFRYQAVEVVIDLKRDAKVEVADYGNPNPRWEPRQVPVEPTPTVELVSADGVRTPARWDGEDVRDVDLRRFRARVPPGEYMVVVTLADKNSVAEKLLVPPKWDEAVDRLYVVSEDWKTLKVDPGVQ